MLKTLLIVALSSVLVLADGLSQRLAASVQSRYGSRMRYATIVPHGKLHFAAIANVDSDTRNSTGKKTHWAIYEYVGGRWKYIFEFDAGVDADAESARLDTLFSRHRFSSDMRGKLMYGDEQRL